MNPALTDGGGDMMKLSQAFERFLPATIGAALVLSPGLARTGSAQSEGVRLEASAVNLSGVGRSQAQKLEIVLNRWSSDATRDKLMDALVSQGSDRLLDVLQSIKPRVGYIRTPTSLGWDIQYARESPLPEGGRRIVFATDRPISFFEAATSPRSAEYEFMLCEVHLDRDGRGEGKLATMAKIGFDKKKNVIEIENYGLEPVRLTDVRVTR
jgi:hypothetical protein